MFRPEKMSFVSISVIEQYITHVLDKLTKLGVMHVVDKEDLPPGEEVLEDIDIEPIQNRLAALSNRVGDIFVTLSISSSSASAFSGVEREKIEIDPFNIADSLESEVSEIEGDLTPFIQRRVQIQSEIQKLEMDSHQLAALEASGVKVEDLRESKFLYLVYGDIPEEYRERLVESLEDVPCVIASGEMVAGNRQILACSLMSDKEALTNALEAAYFSRAKIPEQYSGSITDVLDEIELEMWARREEMAEIEGEIRSLRKRWGDRLLEINATISANRIVIESLDKFGKAGESYLLSGWVPYDEVKKLQAELEDITEDGVVLSASEPISAEEAEHHKPKVPTKLKHPFFLRPFTSLVTNFGVPGYADIDPTPIASLAFLAMFGIMFADVGHGMILFLLGLLGYFYPLPQLKSLKNMASFLACCGIASMLFGFVFGSFFGREDILKPLWFSLEHMDSNAVKRMLQFGVYFGIGILSVGVSINIAQSLRRKDFKNAIFGQWGIFSLFFYWVAAYLANLSMTNRGFSWHWIIVVLLLLLPIMLKEPIFKLIRRNRVYGYVEEEGEGIIESGFEIYEVVMAYLGHTLSYIRMAAFNLSHAGLMMAFYSLTKELPGGDNFFLALPSNILSNVFVIVLEGLIVAIQCMRLEYYEFFSKFFAGEGIEYKPMKIGE